MKAACNQAYGVFCATLVITSGLYFCLGGQPARAVEADGFGAVKRILENKIYADHPVTIYCGAKFDESKNISLPFGFHTPAHEGRTARMEWEHAVPAENFGREFKEWREGDAQCVKNYIPFKGRKCAAKASREYRRMEADMHNLFPAIGSVNATRGNRQYAELPGVPVSFGSCRAKVEGKYFEPPDAAKGAVARAALYMENQYPRYRISSRQKKLFQVWSSKYPVDAWECLRAWRIEKLQGNENVFVSKPCIAAGLWPEKQPF